MWIQRSCLLPRLVWEGEVELWTVEQKGEERRERASPSSITQYLNPIPLELREAGRKMPLPRQPPLLFVGCWLFTKEITCKLGSAGQNTKRGSNLQVITESPRNNFQNTKISFVSYLLLPKYQKPYISASNPRLWKDLFLFRNSPLTCGWLYFPFRMV